MHHKKDEVHDQFVSPSPLQHYRLATRSSALKLNKSTKVKRLTQRSIRRNDETRLSCRRTSECYQHSTPLASGTIALHPSAIQSSSSSSPPYVQRRRLFNQTSQMTSYSALKRKAQRPDSSSNFSRFQVHLEHVWGFTSLSNSIVSQDRSTLAYAAGSTVVLYDIHNQKQDFIVNNARKSITSLSLSADGRYLATGESGHDPKVRVWDLTGDRTASIDLGDHKFAIDSVCFSPNVDRLISIGSLHDGNIYVWNWKEKKKLASNKCTCAIRRVAFAEDGSYFVTVGNRHVKFWYLMSAASLEVVPLRGRYAILAERKDNFFTDVVCGRGDCAGMTYVITSTGLICQFDEHRQMRAERDLQEKTNCLAIGDQYLVVGCVKGAVYVFAPQTLDYLMSMPLPHYLGVDIAFITSIDQMTYPNQQNLSFPDTIAVCLDEDKSVLTCFYNDHSFYTWDIRNDRSIKKYDSHLFHSGCGWAIETYSRPNATSAGSALTHLSCMTCSSDNSIRFWSLASHPTSSNIFSRQLMKIIYLDDDSSKLCDSQTIQERPEFVPKVGGRCMKLNPDGLSMAVGDRHGNIRIFDLDLFQQIAILEAHDSEVLSVDYGRSSSDVMFLASSSRDRFIHIFDVKKDYQLVATLDDHSAAITAVRFTFSSITSNLQLISCGADKSLIFRSISKNENGKYQFIRSNNIVEKQTFYDLAIDHTRESVSTACQDRMIRVYNLQDGKRLRICKGSMSDDLGYLIKMDLDPAGRYLATSCSNKCVYIWDTNTSECLASLCGHGEIVTDLKFSPDGSHLYTISGDSCIFIWNITESTVATTNARLPPTLCSTKSTEIEVTETEETISQTPNIIEEHQPHMKRQRSLWGTAESRLPLFETKFFRPLLPDVVKDDPCCQLSSSHHSSQYDECASVDEEEETTFSTALTHNDTTVEQTHSFFAENYDHDNAAVDTTVHDERKPRKSVSARFRSGSQENTAPNNNNNPSLNSTQEDVSITSHRPSAKQIRSQVSAPATTANSEPRAAPSKNPPNRGTRISRTRSEDRFHGLSTSLGQHSIDQPVNANLPSYAAHTSSSMNKLRDQTSANSTPTSASSNATVRTPTNAAPPPTRSSSSSRKNIMKSCSTQSLILPPPGTTNPSNSASKVSSNTHRTKMGVLSRRPPNLPIATHTAHSTSTSSSSTASSNFSSPTKFLPAEEIPPALGIETSTVPLRPLDNTDDEPLPKWAQDSFYRTVVLGLKPLLLRDSPSSPIKTIQTSLSTCSIESSDSLEIHSELQACPVQRSTIDVQVRRSVSISDYRQLKPLSQTSSNESNNDRDDDSIQDDHRVSMIQHLVDNFCQPLNELEQLYSTVSQSSSRRDLMLKEYIEEIFTNLHRRITTTYQQQENRTPVAIND